jgi:hypothetical protein
MDGRAVLEVTISIFTAIAAVVATVSWLVKHYLRELIPNGGSSMNDKIKLEIVPLLNDIRKDQIKIGLKVAKLDGRLEEHIKEHK